MPMQAGNPQRAARSARASIAARIAVLCLAGCASVTPALDPSRQPSTLPLFRLAPERTQVDFEVHRAGCTAPGIALDHCLGGLGHRRITNAEAAAFLARANDPAEEPVPLALAALRIDDGRYFFGRGELYPRERSSSVILDAETGTLRCDGTARTLRPGTAALRPAGDAFLLCGNGSLMLVALAFDTPSSGYGAGWDTNGNRYRFLFGPAELTDGKEARKALRRALAAAASAGGWAAEIGIRRPFSLDQERYALRYVRRNQASVPRQLVSNMPRNLTRLVRARDRKDAFVRVMLPPILLANDFIASERRHMLDIVGRLARNEPVGELSRTWLRRLARRYGARADDFPTLRYRVDTVPPSLALAQAALETGWGTSRFVREGNAVFGEWTFGARRGIVPTSRGASQNHKIRSFDTLLHSIVAYMDNLNSHPAYRKFRARRARTRALGRTPDSHELAAALASYGAGDARYTAKLRTLIRANRLRDFDRARLADAVLVATPTPRPKPVIQAAAGPESESFGDTADRLMDQLLHRIRGVLDLEPGPEEASGS
ncbi:MAG: glucosaminidase domain-containing protein [Alphaproteobacteria bacterium]